MKRDWKPGDVAMVQNEFDVWNTAILQVQPTGLKWVYGVAYANAAADWPARPLVVIDPEDREQVERLWQAWRDLAPDHRLVQDNLQAALREFANPTPPRPDEPQGLGAVVRATCPCEGPSKFVHEPQSFRFEGRPGGRERPWKSHCGHHVWADLTDVEILSEGVTP